MNHRKATAADVDVIKEILTVSGLPAVDCDEHIDNFIVIEEKGGIIGVGGLEIHGSIALVRSIAVVPEYRGKGLARMIYKLIEDKARGLGISELYVITESAAEYFKRFGFVVIERCKVPGSIAETRQFKELCTSSAMVMNCKL